MQGPTKNRQGEWAPWINVISYSNWNEWSTIQGVIARVIQNWACAKREADFKLRTRLLPEFQSEFKDKLPIGHPRDHALIT